MTESPTESGGMPVKSWEGRLLDARLQILDRQLHDHNGDPIGTVDDIELEDIPVGRAIPRSTPPPRIKALVSGPVLGTRIFGGRPPRSRQHFIPWDLIDRIEAVVTLRSTADEFDTTWAERWLRHHVIGRIPGGHHAAE
jgi:sporulation protein YlmC with PRC-barrel domain